MSAGKRDDRGEGCWMLRGGAVVGCGILSEPAWVLSGKRGRLCECWARCCVLGRGLSEALCFLERC